MWLVGHMILWPFKKNYKKKSRGGGAAPAGSPTPPGPFGAKRRVLRAAEVQLLGPQVPDPGEGADRKKVASGSAGASRRTHRGGDAGTGPLSRDEPPSTTWPRKPRPERGGAGLRPARLAGPRLPRHRRGRPATACHAGPRGPPHALQTVTRAPQPRRGWRGSRKAGRTGEPAPGARCSAGP